jgi:hypothetical protein
MYQVGNRVLIDTHRAGLGNAELPKEAVTILASDSPESVLVAFDTARDYLHSGNMNGYSHRCWWLHTGAILGLAEAYTEQTKEEKIATKIQQLYNKAKSTQKYKTKTKSLPLGA